LVEPKQIDVYGPVAHRCRRQLIQNGRCKYPQAGVFDGEIWVSVYAEIIPWLPGIGSRVIQQLHPGDFDGSGHQLGGAVATGVASGAGCLTVVVFLAGNEQENEQGKNQFVHWCSSFKKVKISNELPTSRY
jgi:hypothetical protein